MVRKTVVLFKGSGNQLHSIEDKSDPYLEILKKNDIFAAVIPPLQFNYINTETLTNNLQRADDFTGIIFTSPRAVEAVHQINCTPGFSLLSWKDKTNYSVGKGTATMAKTLLQLDTIGEETGSSEKLCGLILSSRDSLSTFLFPCSNLRKDTIPKTLSENGIKVVEVVCYETAANSSLIEVWEKLISEQDIPDILVYFSPSGVQFSYQIIQTYYNSQPKCVAIGPTTAQALVENLVTPCNVCKCPTPEFVLEAVKCVIAN